MSVAIKVKPGAEVPITLQLSDGATDQFPRALVYDNDENLLQTIDLDHEANGYYAPGTDYTMPSEIFIRVVYIVYSNSGHTTENVSYSRSLDIFSLDTGTKDLLASRC